MSKCNYNIKENSQLHPIFQGIVNSFTDYNKIKQETKPCGTFVKCNNAEGCQGCKFERENS
jgi:hypothetical protein